MFGKRDQGPVEYPRLVSVETTNRCNASCPFCPNNALERDRRTMDDALFEKIIEDCRAFPLRAIEPFLNGEPFVDPQIVPRLEHIRRRLPRTRLQLYTNGYALTPKKIDAIAGLGLHHLFISLNTLDPEKYRSIMGLDLERTLRNIEYLTEPARRQRVARRITLRMTRTADTRFEDQVAFEAFCRERQVRPFIVGLFNYRGAVWSDLPVPAYPCEHITRVDILSDGRATLCCMDEEGAFSWGDAKSSSVLEIYHGAVATRYKSMHRTGRRRQIAPCDTCNVFWPSLEKMPALRTAEFAALAGFYFARHRPVGKKRPGRPCEGLP